MEDRFKPCWHCGDRPIYMAGNYFEGKIDTRPCCYNYPYCISNVTKNDCLACDICYRNNIKTYITIYPHNTIIYRYCARCLSETNGLRNTRDIKIFDDNYKGYYHDMFPHPNSPYYENMNGIIDFV